MIYDPNLAVKAVTKTDLVVENVINSIVNEQYKPGDKLPAENFYVKNCGVSRVTVREAFKKLNSMGVVSIRQGDGTFVDKINPFEIKGALLPLLIANRQMIDDLYETRVFIEQAILELVIERKTLNDVKVLQNLVKDMGDAISNSNLKAYSIADLAFHDALAAMCCNSVLENIYDSISIIRCNSVAKSNTSMDSIKKSILDHKHILEAIIDNNTDRAKSVMKAHLLCARQIMVCQSFDEGRGIQL